MEQGGEFEIVLSMAQTSFRLGEDVILYTSVKNLGTARATFCKYHTPFEGIANEIFEVSYNGEPIDYRGVLMSRIGPGEKDYIHFEPGEKVSCEVTLNNSYDLKQEGRYTIRLGASVNDFLSKGNELSFVIEGDPLPIFEVWLCTDKERYKVGEEIALTMRVINEGDTTSRFCQYHTPFEGIMNDIFEVKRKGRVLDYQGIMKDRVPPEEEDFIILKPQQSIDCQVILGMNYNTEHKGKYTIRFRGSGINDLPNSNEVEFEVV